MPQTTRRGVAPLNPQPRWPEGYIAVMREAGAQEKTIPHCEGKGDVGSDTTYKMWRSSGISSEFAARFTAEVVTPKYRAISAPGYPIFFTAN